MNALTNLVALYNLPFTLLLLMCFAFGAMQLIGLGGEAEHGADADVHLDHDLDHDLEHDLDQDADHGGEAGGSGAGTFSLLAFLGVGKAPMAVGLMVLLGAVGIIGLILNNLITGLVQPYPGLALAGVLPVSVIAGSFITSRIARLIGRALPPISTTATRAQGLVGKQGIVISPFVDGKYGMVRLRDRGGTQISVFATAVDGQPIARGQQVTLEAFDASNKQFRVSKQ